MLTGDLARTDRADIPTGAQSLRDDRSAGNGAGFPGRLRHRKLYFR